MMRNLIYLFKVLYDIAYDPDDASKCASISINHSKTTIDLISTETENSFLLLLILVLMLTLLPKSTQ